eukprot:SAG31_NODE_1626_length_7710_cov_28.409933_4_plen_47_part_00
MNQVKQNRAVMKLRGPQLLSKRFLEIAKETAGAVVVCSSSTVYLDL